MHHPVTNWDFAAAAVGQRREATHKANAEAAGELAEQDSSPHPADSDSSPAKGPSLAHGPVKAHFLQDDKVRRE